MLNSKQEMFVQYLIKGMSQREAYKKAYNAKYKDEAIDSKACLLFNTDKVQKRYNELLEKLQDKSIMTAKERMIWLSNVVKGNVTHTSYDSNGNSYENEAYISDKSIDVLNKMSGEYKTILTGNVEISYEEALRAVSDKNEY